MNLKKEDLFWKKKEFVSFILSILVFFIHSHFIPEEVGNSIASVVNHKFFYFFSRSVTQFAVPAFFMLSGITFFKGYSNKKYLSKIKARIRTLVIPFLLWNTVWMIWEIFCSYSFLSRFSASAEQYPLTVASILKGIFFYGCNVPFWFIFDLIVFSFAAPLIFPVIRNKYVGISAIVCLSAVSLLGIHLPMNLFYYPMAIVFYLTGAVIGYHYFDFISAKSSKPVQFASVAVLSAYIIAKNIVPQELHIKNYLTETIVYTVAAFALWNIVDMFIEKIKPRAIYRRSFAIYAMHLNVALIVLKILTLCIPGNELMEIPKFVIMIVSTLVIINCVCIILEKFLPGVYSLFMGNRTKKSDEKQL